jgi:AraC-like DNA-binding protein
MVRFEVALAKRSGPHLNLSELCTAIGVPERTLRLCCAEYLGVSPIRYYLLRRLNMARVLRRLREIISSSSSVASPWPTAPSSAKRHHQHCAALQSKRNN